MGLDRAPIEFQTFYFFHVWLDPPTGGSLDGAQSQNFWGGVPN